MGPFKDEYGTTASVIEAASNKHRIVGHVIAPGNVPDISTYRSKLTEILATIVMINQLSEFYNLTEGVVEFGCDGLTAM
jgi:hypothetical protein